MVLLFLRINKHKSAIPFTEGSQPKWTSTPYKKCKFEYILSDWSIQNKLWWKPHHSLDQMQKRDTSEKITSEMCGGIMKLLDKESARLLCWNVQMHPAHSKGNWKAHLSRINKYHTTFLGSKRILQSIAYFSLVGPLHIPSIIPIVCSRLFHWKFCKVTARRVLGDSASPCPLAVPSPSPRCLLAVPLLSPRRPLAVPCSLHAVNMQSM